MSRKIANGMHYSVSVVTLPILIGLLTKKYLGNNKKSTLGWAICLCQQYLLQFWQRNADRCLQRKVLLLPVHRAALIIYMRHV